jgi:epoxyqueuosine reductase
MSRFDLTRPEIERIAAACELSIVGITDAEPFEDVERYLVEHVERGHMRGMDWFTTQRARESSDPRALHPTARSIISVAVPYWSGCVEPPDDGVLRGRIARYAWGRDYHKTLKRRMTGFVAHLEAAIGREIDARTLVDTARIVDRAVAARAGTGWYGKNTLVIVPGHGSWVMLGEVITDLELPVDVPLTKDCGRCGICLDRCPTGAIIEPYRIDSPRCISYLTIEERGAIPHELRPLMANHVFGCDVCQDVCPYTRAARVMEDQDFAPRTIDNVFPSLAFLATMSVDEFRSVYSGTPVTRAKRSGIARNAAVALGNSADERAEPLLCQMLLDHDEPLARGHAAGALRRLIDGEAVPTLERALRIETDAYVKDEIKHALAA